MTRRTAGLLVLMLLAVLPAGPAVGQELWMARARSIGPWTSCPTDPVTLQWCGPDRRWHAADLESFLAGNHSGAPVIVYAHGNPSEPSTCMEQSWTLFCNLRQRAGGQPFRLVCWMWPAPAESYRLEIMQYYSARAESEAFACARFLRRIDPAVPVSLIGFSFGARVVMGGLHLIAGGGIGSYGLEPSAAAHRPYRVALLAPALNNTWLCPGQRYGLALSQCERVLIAINPRDFALRHYHRLYRNSDPVALGDSGPVCCSSMGTERYKLEVVNVSPYQGIRHVGVNYLSGPLFLARLPYYAYLRW